MLHGWRFPKDLYEAARIDGATPYAAFRRVTMPLLGPAIVVALLFRYIFAFRIFSEVWLMTQGGPARSTEVVAVYLYQEAFRFNAFGTAAATAWIMVVASLILAAAMCSFFAGRWSAMRIERLAIGLGKAVAVGAILIWSLFPIAFIVMSAFKPGQDIFAVPPKFVFTPTGSTTAKLWADWGMFFDGLAQQYHSSRSGPRSWPSRRAPAPDTSIRATAAAFSNASVLFLIIVRLIPPIVVTLPLFPIINAIGLNDTHIVLIVLYATFFVSLGTVLMRTFIDQIPRELDEAAQIDGATA